MSEEERLVFTYVAFVQKMGEEERERPVAVRLFGTSKGRAAVCTRCNQYRKGEFFISFARTPCSITRRKERRRRRGQFLTCVLCRENKAWAMETKWEKINRSANTA